MEKVKIAKDEAVPQLKEDGSNYELWRSSYLAYYCCQMEVVMAIASDPSVKPQKIGTEEEKMLTTTIFKSIHPRLRVVYINQKDLLKNGYKLWEALEERFQALDQQEQDMEKFLTAKQGNRPLHKFVVEYDNLRRKLGMDCLSKIMDEAAMIRHLHRALSPLSQTLFPHGLLKIDEVVRRLQENARLCGDLEERNPMHTALANQRTPRTPRCFKCGQQGHVREKCPNPLKCFKCNGTGHISRSCPKA